MNKVGSPSRLSSDPNLYEEENQKTTRSLLDTFIEEQKKIKINPLENIEMVETHPHEQNQDQQHCDNKIWHSQWEHVMIQMSEEFGTEIENFLMQLSTCYQLYGCPVHIIEINMPKVAKGLGITADFAVFPTFQLVCFKRTSENGKIKKNTQFFTTSYGLDMYKLQLVDELVRRISSYATLEPPKKLKQEDMEILAEKARRMSAISMSRLLEQVMDTEAVINRNPATSIYPPTLDELRDRFEKQDSKKTFASNYSTQEHEELKKKILDMAAYGPGLLSHAGQFPSPPASPVTQAPTIRAQPDVSPLSPSDNPNKAVHTESRRTSMHSKDDNVWRYYKTFVKIALEDGFKNLNSVACSPKLYNKPTIWILNGLAAAGCCGLFFGGNWIDVAVSLIVGLLVSALGDISQAPNFVRVYECLAAFFVSFLVRIVHHYVTPLCYKAVTLSSVIWLLQGVTITLSIVDILTRKLISGTVRLFYGITISAIIGFGLDLGTALYARILEIDKADAMSHTACSDTRGLDPRWNPLTLVVTSVSFNMLINAHPKQLFPMFLVAVVGYTVDFFLQPQLGRNAGSVASAFTTSLSASAYARWSGDPAIIFTLSGLLLLVPGSLAVTGFFTILQKDVPGGIGIVLDVLMVAMSLSIGLFLGSLLIVQDESLAWLKKIHLIETSQFWKNKKEKKSDLII